MDDKIFDISHYRYYLETLDDIEKQWLEVAASAIADVVNAHPQEQFYAAAFHLFSATDETILSPALAANIESAVVFYNEKDGSTLSTRWEPPEWKWDVLDRAADAMKPFYSRLSNRIEGASDSQWETVINMHDYMMARVARRLTADARGGKGKFHGLSLSSDFVVAVLEGQRAADEYNRLVRASVDPDILTTLDGILFID